MRSDRPIRRILVIRRKALGDALVTLPAMYRLAAAFPSAQIDLVVDRPLAPLLQDLAHGCAVLAWPPPPSRRPWWLRLRDAGYDLVIDYLGSPRTALWTALSGAPLRVGFDLPRRRWAYNVRVPRNRRGAVDVVQFAGEAFLDPLRALGLAPAAWRPGEGASCLTSDEQTLGTAYRAWQADWVASGRPRVALMFSATWPAKAWPAREGAALYRQLAAQGLDPVLVTGPGDAGLAAELRAAAPEARFAPPTTLPELAHLLARCSIYVGTDNGPRHLAALLGVPTLTLFGPTDPRGWNPEDPRHVAVTAPVACAPCNLTRCPIPGHPCLDGLPAATVAAAVRKLLAQLQAARPAGSRIAKELG